MEYNGEEIKEKYKDLFKYSLNFIYVHDMKGNFLDANDVALTVLGYKRDEISSLSFKDLIDKEQLVNAFNTLKELKETGKQSKPNEFKLKTKDNKFIYIETYGIPLSKNGEIHAILGIGTNITNHKIDEQILKESEEKYRILFETHPNSIILLNYKGIIVECNEEIERILDLNKEEIIGSKFSDLFPISTTKKFWEIESFKKLKSEDLIHSLEFKFVNKKGKSFWFNLFISLVNLKHRILFQVIVQDITTQKEAEILIKKEINKLKELDDIKSEFIYRASHELKTPLNSVYATSQILLDSYRDQFSDSALELMELIYNGGKRLKLLAADLLEVSRMEAKKLELKKRKENIAKIINECVNYIKPLTKQRKLFIDVAFNADIYIEIDKIRFEEVIMNLLSNAIKNTPPKGKITIALRKLNESVEIEVKDTGVGFTNAEKKRIFKKFAKIERYGKRMNINTEGSGLGLYISKQIVDLHGGQIWVESEGRNKGSTFKIKLPLSTKT